MKSILKNTLDLERRYGQLIMQMNRNEHHIPVMRQKMWKETQLLLSKGHRMLRQSRNGAEREVIHALMQYSQEKILNILKH